jgi:hypothetical protein
MGTGEAALPVSEAADAIVGHVIITKAEAEAATTDTLFNALVTEVTTMLTETKAAITAENAAFAYGAAMTENETTLLESFPNSETRFGQWQYFSSWGTLSGVTDAEVIGRRPLTADHKEDFRLVQVNGAELLWLHDQPGTRYFAQNGAW